MNTTVDLYVASYKLPVLVHYVQYSTEVPIDFIIHDYEIPSGATARFYLRKPSGNEVYNDCTISGNKITLQPSAQTFAEKGLQKAQLQLMIEDDFLISFPIDFDVAENIIDSSAIESSNEYGALESLLQEAQTNIPAAGEAATAANQAAQAANNAAGTANNAANAANTAAAAANQAKQNADTATSAANNAANAANTAAGQANTARDAANSAANAANTAASAANSAAEKINVMADYVVEQGVSGGWTYIKWNSGRAECYKKTTSANLGTTGQINGFYYRFHSINLPTGLFIEVTDAQVSADWGTAVSWGSVKELTTTAIEEQYFSNQNGGAGTFFRNVKGRWK